MLLAIQLFFGEKGCKLIFLLFALFSSLDSSSVLPLAEILLDPFLVWKVGSAI